jgi:hypothetical protein
MTIAVATPKARTASPPIAAVGVRRTKNHQYYFGDKGPWPGVTTVTDVLDKPALTKWHKEQVAQAAIASAERLLADRESGNVEAAVAYLLATRNEGTSGRERGTRIHGALESILRREPVEIDSRDAPAIEGARAWLNEHQVKPIEVEAFLINEEQGYGGTCDLIAEIDGETWLLDWKSSKSVAWPSGQIYDEMRLQLVAYSRAEFIARIADPDRYPLPVIERLGILHVTDSGTRLYPAEVSEDDWVAFRACLYVFNWRKGKAA